MTDQVSIPSIYGNESYDDSLYSQQWGSNAVVDGGAYATTTRIYLADRDGRKLEELPLDMPVTGSVDYSQDTAISRSLSLEVNNPHLLTPFGDYLIPEVTLSDAAGNVTRRELGHFIVTPPRTHLSAVRYSGTLEAKDLTWLLVNDTYSGDEVIPAGTDTGEAAREIAQAAMANAQVNIPNTGIALATEFQINAGDSRMDVMTDVLKVANWYRPWMTSNGVLVSAREIDLLTAAASRRYSTQDRNITIVPPIDETPEWTRLRNRVTVRKIVPGQDVIYATAEVTNPDSPVHPLNLGRSRYGDAQRPLYLSEVVEDGQVESVEQALARAETLLAAGASWYRPLNIVTIVDLDADAHDVIELDVQHQGARYEGLWMRRAWSIRLRGVTALTESRISRVERWRA